MSFENKNTINVGLIGFGTVGKGVVKYFEEGRGEPFGVALKKVAVNDLSKPRDAKSSNLTDDASSIIKDPSIDIVVELIGGTGLAREYIFGALDARKSVVTANKAVVSKDMPELFNLARERQVGFGFEASVGGGIPIIRTLLGYRGQTITRLDAILNGTTNFILSRMESGIDFNSALVIAQEKGFAEANHILDTGGFDTQAKLSILASLILNTHVKLESIPCRGITEVGPIDTDFAAKFGVEEGERGYAVKLLASARQHNGTWDLGVSPALVSKDHPLASVRDEMNAVTIEGDLTGPQTFIGKGAGTNPTASAVITNILQLADDLRQQTQGYLPLLDNHVSFTKPEDIEEIGYIRVNLLDIPRSMQELGRILGDHDLSVQHSLQRGRFAQSIEGKTFIPDIVTLHPARKSMIEKALEQLAKSDRVYGEPFFMQLSQ
ncbi:MAG: homoserine dehydrogenase [Candidatus Daviesbacteria bacterium]|nr:homoserine dehydrogenase [Candidatus Daviesbacteria bacterium]